MRILAMWLVFCGVGFGEPEAVDFPFEWGRVGESRIDLSRFLDGPAGRGGALRAVGEKFVTGEGKEIRFWGVNLPMECCFPDEGKAAELADQLARWGINLVRFHHTDTDWGKSFIDEGKEDTRQLDEENMRKFDKMFVELKRRGIWTVLTMNVTRKFKAGDGVRDWEMLGAGKAATYFNPRLIELQYEFTRKVLGHVNAFTGVRYADEAAIMGIELVNENSLVEAWGNWRLRGGVVTKENETWQPIPASYAVELDGLYYDWLVARGTVEQREAVTKETGVSFTERPEVLPGWLRLTPGEFAGAGEVRFHAEGQFLMELEARFFDGYRRLIREELGSKALLTLSNDHNPRLSGYPHLKANMRGDWVDGHGYWEHPTLGEKTSIENTPMVNVPLGSTVVKFARSVPSGYPFTISEVNHAFPHRYAAEGFPILTAYAMFQGWDGIAWFNWRQSVWTGGGEGVGVSGWFDIGVDSVKLAQMAVCGMMWHRGDVRECGEVNVRRYGEREVRETFRGVGEPPFFKKGFDLTLPLRRKVRFEFQEGADVSKVNVVEARRWDDAPGRIDAEGGELGWSFANEGEGVVKIDTERTSGLVGFVKKHFWDEAAMTRHLKVEVENEHVSVVVTAMDDRAIAVSERLLVAAVCRSSNTGQLWEDDLRTLAAWGTGPLRVVPVMGKIFLKGLEGAERVEVWPLSAEGVRREGSFAAERTDEGWRVDLKVAATLWEVVVVRGGG